MLLRHSVTKITGVMNDETNMGVEGDDQGAFDHHW